MTTSPARLRKAVLPVAGLGTRVLPGTKTTPKELLNVVDRPILSYIVEEAREAGIEHIVFVTGRAKQAIEDYFDHQIELEAQLEAKGKTEDAEAMRNVAAMTVAAPVTVAAPTKLAGVSSRKVWKASVTDRAAAIKAMADNPAYQHLLTIDESALNKLAAAMKNCPIAGVVFYEDSVISARAA